MLAWLAALAVAGAVWLWVVRQLHAATLYAGRERALIRARRARIAHDPDDTAAYLDLLAMYASHGDVRGIEALLVGGLPLTAQKPELEPLRAAALGAIWPAPALAAGRRADQAIDLAPGGLEVRMGAIKAIGLLSVDELVMHVRKTAAGVAVTIDSLAARVTQEDVQAILDAVAGATRAVDAPQVTIDTTGITVRALAGIVPFTVRLGLWAAGGPRVRIEVVEGPRALGLLPVPERLWLDRAIGAMPFGPGVVEPLKGAPGFILDVTALYPVPVGVTLSRVEPVTGEIRVLGHAPDEEETCTPDRVREALEALDRGQVVDALVALEKAQALEDAQSQARVGAREPGARPDHAQPHAAARAALRPEGPALTSGAGHAGTGTKAGGIVDDAARGSRAGAPSASPVGTAQPRQQPQPEAQPQAQQRPGPPPQERAQAEAQQRPGPPPQGRAQAQAQPLARPGEQAGTPPPGPGRDDARVPATEPAGEGEGPRRQAVAQPGVPTPARMLALAARAKALVLLGRGPEAAELLEALRIDAPLPLEALSLAADTAHSVGRADQTASFLDRAIPHLTRPLPEPGTREARALGPLARVAAHHRPVAQARPWALAYRRLFPLDCGPYVLLARLEEDRNELGAAHAFHAAAAALAPGAPFTEDERRTKSAFAPPTLVVTGAAVHPADDRRLEPALAPLGVLLEDEEPEGAVATPGSRATQLGLYLALDECCERLGQSVPPVFIASGPRRAVSLRDGQLTVPWEVLSRLRRREAMFVLGRVLHAGSRGLAAWLAAPATRVARAGAVLTLRRRLGPLAASLLGAGAIGPVRARLADWVAPRSAGALAVLARRLGPDRLRAWLALPPPPSLTTMELLRAQQAIIWSSDRGGLYASGSPGASLRALKSVWGDGWPERRRLEELLAYIASDVYLARR